MKAILTLTAFALLLAMPAARADSASDGLSLAEDILMHKEPEPLPAKEEKPEEPKTTPADDAPIPAVAVSVATIAEAPGSLAFEMKTVGLLADAPTAEAAPAGSAAVAKR